MGNTVRISSNDNEFKGNNSARCNEDTNKFTIEEKEQIKKIIEDLLDEIDEESE